MKSIKAIAAAIVVSTSASVYADPMIIQEWSFINEAGFANFTATNKPANATNEPTLSGDSADGGTSILSGGSLPDNLCWGDPVGNSTQQSCLSINSQVTSESTQSWNENGVFEDINDGAPQGNVQTVAIDGDYTGAFKQGTAIRHENFPITGQFLDTVTIQDGLRLQATMPEGLQVNAPELSFLVDFWETPNRGVEGDGTCPFGPTAGTPGSVNEKGCSDLFQVIGFEGGASGLNILAAGPDFIDFSVKFKVTGVDASMYHRDYELITRLSGLDVAFDGLGFATSERGVNVLNAEFAVRAIDAPEPSTLAIFAASLLALSGFTRRKAK
ncbi:THxN family PEP-CTERM protein [Alteromonas ponticola]|uniref:PEP-CTERM sorting domain-containing protein n=1 Tax=Alteromonas ponticola TaxID=2720613 RepID=A0ABX1R1N0_9ALTE|nr:THxN family PEP-CTERM protein [Alteromonas ponticola]NMH59831.1 PEP-CTERM sorting domain-containing protein [Alteromonas ponticola]